MEAFVNNRQASLHEAIATWVEKKVDDGKFVTHILVKYEYPRSDGTGTYYWSYVCTLSEFIAIQRDPAFTHCLQWHETIHPSLPCKGFADVDFPGVSIEEGNGRVVIMVCHMKSRMQKKLGMEHVPDPYIYDSHREGKYSVHIIFPIWFETPLHVYELFKDIPGIDLQCYPLHDTPKSLRFPYSHKYGHTASLIERSARDSVFDIASFARGCVTIQSEEEEWKPYFPMADSYISFPLTIARSFETLGMKPNMIHHPPTFQVMQRIVDYIRRTKSPNPRKCRLLCPRTFPNGSWDCVLSPGLYCHGRNGTHKRQSTYIGSDDSKRVWYRCPDINCRITLYFEEDFSLIAHPVPRPSLEELIACMNVMSMNERVDKRIKI
jgi:hypothetical protein